VSAVRERDVVVAVSCTKCETYLVPRPGSRALPYSVKAPIGRSGCHEQLDVVVAPPRGLTPGDRGVVIDARTKLRQPKAKTGKTGKTGGLVKPRRAVSTPSRNRTTPRPPRLELRSGVQSRALYGVKARGLWPSQRAQPPSGAVRGSARRHPSRPIRCRACENHRITEGPSL